MLAPLLSRLAPGIRRTIYKDYLGARSMSIALLRQTCADVRSEIDHASTLRWNGETRPIFEKRVDTRKLDGCSMGVIESAVGPFNTCNVDVNHWDDLFCNAVEIENLSDVDRLLDIFVYPMSEIFRCGSLSTWFDASDDGLPRTHSFDLFVYLVSKCDRETIQHYHTRLPCECARQRFVCSAIKQCLFGLLDALSKYLEDTLIYQNILGSMTRLLARAVGSSGSKKMLEYIVRLLNPDHHAAYYSCCYITAAGSNHVSLLHAITFDQNACKVAFVCALSNACMDTIQHIQHLLDSPIPSNLIRRFLAATARTGNSAAFQLVLSLQADPSATEWHSSFGNDFEGVYSLSRAFERSAQDFFFFLDLYSNHFASLLVPPVTTEIGESKTWTFILRHSKHLSASRLNVLLKNIPKYMCVDERELYLDTLHFLLQHHKFARDLVNVVIEPFLSCLVSRPLSVNEVIEMALMTYTDEAFDWVKEHFEVAISAQEATEFLVRVYDQSVDDNFELHANYVVRCLKLGAKLEPGRSIVGDIVSMQMGIPFQPPKNVGPDYLTQIFGHAIQYDGLDVIKMLVTGFESTQLQNLQNKLEKACCATTNGGLRRSKYSGCFTMVDMPSLLAEGQLRLYHYACKLCGVVPVDPKCLDDLVLERI